ncbi:MAG: recombination protein RecR [Chitinophagaceae bacterium]|nr:recombination protein RecR [Chitinophagaceae bacterium]
MNFSSSLLENAVNELAKLPGIGKKTALRLALHLLKKETSEVEVLVGALSKMKHEIKFCVRCGNISDSELCNICKQSSRNNGVICVVESIKDVLAIENTQQYNGLYHILGGVISPLDGVGPDDLTIDALVKRVDDEKVEELVFALSPNIQGDTTIYYIGKKLAGKKIKITTIARGIAFGGELEYADELTLARSIANRMPVESYVNY